MNFLTKLWYSNFLLYKIISLGLFPLSLLWIFIDQLKFFLIKPYLSTLKIICIGNVNVGGTGKTPIAIFIFKTLKKMGYKPVFLTSGYKGKISKPSLVKSNKLLFGDEALILKTVGPTVISKNRLEGVKFIENLCLEKKNYNIIIMDDGLQNYSIKKTLSFLTIDRNFLFGNGFCIPSGPLRQPFVSCKKNIDKIILTGNKSLKKKYRCFDYSVFNSYIEVNKNNTKNNYFAFSGIGNNLKFFQTLEDANFNIVKTKQFIDHHIYKEDEIVSLIKMASDKNLKLITTEKDFVKIPKKYHSKINCIKMKIEFDKHDFIELQLLLKKKLNV